jgi:hypothetical protein
MEPVYVHSIASNGEDRGIFVPSDILCARLVGGKCYVVIGSHMYVALH